MKNSLLLFILLFCPVISLSQSADTDYIKLTSGLDGLNRPNSIRVAFYIDIADSLNAVGVNFRVVATRIREDTTAINWLSGALLDSVAIGAKIEVFRTVRFDAALTKGQKQAIIDDVFTNNLASFLEKWYAEHDFHGGERIIP